MRAYVCLLIVAAGCLSAADKAGAGAKSETVRGKLVVRAGQPSWLETEDHKLIALDGDQPTRKVIHDPRVNGFQVNATGHFTAPDKFLIDPQHTHALMVREGGLLKMITYWCDVCFIRAYAPGPCVCCQRETTLELRNPDEIR